MEKEKLENLLIDYIDGKLSEEEHRKVDQELMRDEKAYKLYEQLKEVMSAMEGSARIEPPAKLRMGFDQLLQGEIELARKAKGNPKIILFQPAFYRVAAALAFVIIGGGIGFWISKQQRQNEELEAMRKEMNATKQMLMAMLENQQSASQRVLGATVAFKEVETADDQIVDALIQAMNEDQNTNVRIAALEALGKFHSQPSVRRALIASLKTQKDPVVQIALIRLMVEMEEHSITEELERISTDDEALPAVKDEAEAGLLKLS
jgi:anti-sigma factor RsiW